MFSGEQRLSDDDLSALDAWVAADLATSTATWKIVHTHVPPTPVHSDLTGKVAGEHWSPIFEKYGVTQIMGNSGMKHYDSADETYAERTIYGVSTYQVIGIDGKTLTVQCFDGEGNEPYFSALSPRKTSVTRLEYIETLWRAAGSPDASGSPFTDAPDSTALAWAHSAGLILGYGGGVFGADDVITRE